MENKIPFTTSDGKVDEERERLEVLDSGVPKLTSAVSMSFPATVSHIAGEYLSNSKRRYFLENALTGVQPITLCLSQDVESKLAPCWSIGFLSPEHPWESMNVKVDKDFLFKDDKGCLEFLDQESSNFCCIQVAVLVVKLSTTKGDSFEALTDLRRTIGALQNHLSSVRHVVLSISEHAFISFLLKDVSGKAMAVPSQVDPQKMLLEMIDDLETCWKMNRTLTASTLFVFYFKSHYKPASELYLTKFAILLNHHPHQLLHREQAPFLVSDKIMWISFLKSREDLLSVDKHTSQLSHVIHLDESTLGVGLMTKFESRVEQVLCLQRNPFIQRIALNVDKYCCSKYLFRPTLPLYNPPPHSALIELTLESNGDFLDLTYFNTGRLPNLTQLSFTGGYISGYLDRHHVPSLKRLRIDPGRCIQHGSQELRELIYSHCQSIIDSDCPWQFVATNEPGGWSLASYDESIRSPQGDQKEESPRSLSQSLPLIKELMLVASTERHTTDWQSRLKNNPHLEANALRRKDGQLLWMPWCVQKITAFRTSEKAVELKFKDATREQASILTSLTSHRVDLVANGDALSNLQSLYVKDARMRLSGAFPLLERLSFDNAYLSSPWRLDASVLQSFSCRRLSFAKDLSVQLELLPHLSFLEVTLYNDRFMNLPKFSVLEDSLGLSQVNHVVLDKRMASTRFFNRCQLKDVSHLQLAVNASQLPTCWRNTDWKCETLTIDVFANSRKPLQADGKSVMVMLPPLPLVKSLTVTQENCLVLLNNEMPKLTVCSVSSPSMLGSDFECPALRSIHFTGELSESDKMKCEDPTTYSALGARPSLVYFDFYGEVRKMTWNVSPNENEGLSSVKPLEPGDDSSVSHE